MKVLVSACIMGENCKYNGKNNKNSAAIHFLKDKEVISICPEVLAGMETPRPCAEIVNGRVVDENGNESLFQILITIDGQEEFGKNYVVLQPTEFEEDEQGLIDVLAYSFTENADGTEGDLQPIPEDAEDEWDMIEEVFNSFMDEQED